MNADPTVAVLAEALEQALTNITKNRGQTQAMAGPQKKQTVQPYAQRRKAVTYDASTQYGHGNAGVWNIPGVDRDIWMLVPRPMGLSSRLPMVASTPPFTDEFFGYALPVTAGSGSEPANDCAKGPNPGDASTGTLFMPFGKTIRTTDAIDVNRVGQFMNNSEPMDLQAINNMGAESPWVPDPARDPDFLNSELGLKYWTLGLEFERVMESEVFTGNVASNSAATLGKKYFNGLTVQINTGKVDAKYGNPMTALDSLLVNWNNQAYNGSVTLAGQVADFLTVLSSMMNYFFARARITNSLPATWGFALRYDLFYLLTAMWPCSYLTNGCTTGVLNGGTQFVSGAEQVAMRDEMRNPENPGLWVNGIRFPVFITDQNAETTASGRRVSDFFVVNLTARGRSTAFFQYLNYDNPQVAQMEAVAVGKYWTSNNGLYLWTWDTSGYCLDVTGKDQVRLVLRRPDLSGRIQNVGYNAIIPTNVSTPGQLYAIAAGNTIGASSGLYTS